MTIRDRLILMAARTTGVRADEVHDCTPQQASNGLSRLAAAGRLHKATTSHRSVRYFAHAAMRDLYVEAMKLDQFQKRRPAPDPRGDIGSWGPTVSPTKAPFDLDTPVVIPDHVKVQHCPSHPPRYSEQVFEFVHHG